MPCYCSYINIWRILRHRSGSHTASMEHRKTIPGTSALHAVPKKRNLKDFSPRKYNPHDTNLSMLHCMPTFPLLFIRADIMKKSTFVPTYLPFIKANFCLASRLIFSILYESAFSALLICSSVISAPFSTWILTSEKDLKLKKNTFNPFSKEWLIEKGRISLSNYSCQDFYVLVSILILSH